MPTHKIKAEQIEIKLKELTIKARNINPNLESKLKNLCHWIKNKTPGKLREKKYVAAVLVELIKDIEIWFILNQLSKNEKTLVFSQKTPVEKYWFDFLFPQWFEQEDKYFPCWKQKLMKGEYNDNDEPFRNTLRDEIKKRRGYSLWRYILDLSMATDIIVCHTSSNPLCVQYTKSSPGNTLDKKEKWKNTLCYWRIRRGIFVCVHPNSRIQGLKKLVNLSLRQSDDLLDDCYIDFNIDKF